MELDMNTAYEIQAAAFHTMTHMLAPGKDAREGPSMEERQAAWLEWRSANHRIITALLRAVEANL